MVLGYEELTAPERAVRVAVEAGSLVQLPLGASAPADPAEGETWGKEREVRAQLLYELLTSKSYDDVSQRALKLAGARITGTLDLEAVELVCPLLFRDCWFEQPINLAEARASAVRLPGCLVPSLHAEQLMTRGNLELNDGFTCRGEVRLLGGHIGGRLSLTAATLADPGVALNADGLTVDHSMFCFDGFTARGEVRLGGAHIGGRLSLTGATLTSPSGLVLFADGLIVERDMFCSEGFTAEGEVRLGGARVGGDLVFTGATLTNSDGIALEAAGLTVGQNLLCTDGFTVKGGVNLRGARIGSDLAFSGANLTNPGRSALDASRVSVGQAMICGSVRGYPGGFTAQGAVRLVGAHVRAVVSFEGARLTNPDGVALRAAGLTVDQNMFCSDGFVAHGEVNLMGARIGADLSFTGATLSNPGGHALNASRLSVGQAMFCGHAIGNPGGFTAEGAVRLVDVHVGGFLAFRGASLMNPEGAALAAYRLIVDRDLLFTEGFTAQGEVRLVGAQVGACLRFSGARLVAPNRCALDGDQLSVVQDMLCDEGFAATGDVRLVAAHIAGTLDFGQARFADASTVNLQALRARILWLYTPSQASESGFVLPGKSAPAEIDLGYAQVGALADDPNSWPAVVRVRGFRYDALQEPEGPVPVRQRIDWLGRDPAGYSPQPYEQLAAVYRNAGRDDDARRVAITKQRRRRGELHWPGRLWSSLLDLTVGYGYQTWRAATWLLALVAMGWLIFDQAHPVDLVAAKSPGQRPWFHAGLYALDLLLPFADLGYQSAWIAQGWARWLYLAWNLAGWVLVTAVVAALSGVTKRD